MRAHAPGSVTTMFSPAEEGSRGVSFATADGVFAAVEPLDGPPESDAGAAVTLDGEPTSFEPVELACETLEVTPRVDLTAEIPVGRGFGASGAATLATVLAVDAKFDLGHDREALVEVAASAEIEAGTGLGDVYVQDRGGLVWNVGDGRQRRERTDRLSYAAFGDVATAEVLGDEAALDRVRAAADEAFPGFDPEAPLSDLFGTSWEFATATGLVTDRVRDVVGRVRADGGDATMAMVGETVVAVGTDALDGRTRVSPDGARILDGSGASVER